MNASDQAVKKRLLAQRETNPNYELIFQEPRSPKAPEWTPVVPGTMTTLSDGSLAYLCNTKRSMSKKRKCPECKGSGERLAPPSYPPKRMADVPRYKCTECNGTGVEQHFQLMFWRYDQFPYVLASRGFLQDDGLCYCPSYNACFRPIKVMTLEEGGKIAQALSLLAKERDLALANLNEGFRARRDEIAPWLKKS